MLDALSPITPAYAHEGEHEEGGIMFGLSRFSGTLMANLVTGSGFGLLLAGVSLVIGYPITLRNGALWGACGWLAVHMLPAIGLPPELPGFPAAELGDRQAWWLATVALSAVGLYLVVLREEIVAKVVGLALIAAPHVYGAPQPLDISSNVRPCSVPNLPLPPSPPRLPSGSCSASFPASSTNVSPGRTDPADPVLMRA